MALAQTPSSQLLIDFDSGSHSDCDSDSGSGSHSDCDSDSIPDLMQNMKLFNHTAIAV